MKLARPRQFVGALALLTCLGSAQAAAVFDQGGDQEDRDGLRWSRHHWSSFINAMGHHKGQSSPQSGWGDEAGDWRHPGSDHERRGWWHAGWGHESWRWRHTGWEKTWRDDGYCLGPQAVSTPEPSAWILLTAGIALIGALSIRKGNTFRIPSVSRQG